jgi:hypothetical protein
MNERQCVRVRQARKGWLVPSPVLGLTDEMIWNILSFASDSNHLLTSDFIPPEHVHTDRGRRKSERLSHWPGWRSAQQSTHELVHHAVILLERELSHDYVLAPNVCAGWWGKRSALYSTLFFLSEEADIPTYIVIPAEFDGCKLGEDCQDDDLRSAGLNDDAISAVFTAVYALEQDSEGRLSLLDADFDTDCCSDLGNGDSAAKIELDRHRRRYLMSSAHEMAQYALISRQWHAAIANHPEGYLGTSSILFTTPILAKLNSFYRKCSSIEQVLQHLFLKETHRLLATGVHGTSITIQHVNHPDRDGYGQYVSTIGPMTNSSFEQYISNADRAKYLRSFGESDRQLFGSDYTEDVAARDPYLWYEDDPRQSDWYECLAFTQDPRFEHEVAKLVERPAEQPEIFRAWRTESAHAAQLAQQLEQAKRDNAEMEDPVDFSYAQHESALARAGAKCDRAARSVQLVCRIEAAEEAAVQKKLITDTLQYIDESLGTLRSPLFMDTHQLKNCYRGFEKCHAECMTVCDRWRTVDPWCESYERPTLGRVVDYMVDLAVLNFEQGLTREFAKVLWYYDGWWSCGGDDDLDGGNVDWSERSHAICSQQPTRTCD